MNATNETITHPESVRLVCENEMTRNADRAKRIRKTYYASHYADCNGQLDTQHSHAMVYAAHHGMAIARVLTLAIIFAIVGATAQARTSYPRTYKPHTTHTHHPRN